MARKIKYKTPKIEWFGALIFLSPILFPVISIVATHNVIVNEQLLYWTYRLAWIVSALVFLPLMYRINSSEKQLAKRSWTSIKQKLMALTGSVLMLGIFVFLPIWMGVPALIHRVMLSDSGKVVATVKHLGGSTSGVVVLNEYHHFSNNQICCVNYATKLKMKPGDSLRLYGDKTPIGFTVKRMVGD